MKNADSIHSRFGSSGMRLLLVVILFGWFAGDPSLTCLQTLSAQEAPEVEPPDQTKPVPETPKTDESVDPEMSDEDKAVEEEAEAEAEATAEEEAADDSGDENEDKPASTRRQRPDNNKSSDQFLAVFDPIVNQTRMATVEIKSGNKTVAIGAIVDAAGFVLTKQSELKSPLSCVLYNGKTVSATVFGVDPGTDLALLQLSGEDVGNLPVVHWSPTISMDVGSWLASVKGKDDPVVIGVVGVRERLIRPKSGFMGVNLGTDASRVVITNVNDDTPAMRAGIKVGDAIISVNGDEVADIASLQKKVQSYAPGDEIALKILRNEKEIVLELVLGDAEDLNPMFERSNQQNTMGGNELSKRRQNFPLAVQHDGFLKPADCGGPVVSIDGQVVGINIARQGRVSSLMLPTSVVLPVLNELKSGQQAPALVNKNRIDEINRTLQGLRTAVNLSPASDKSKQEEFEQLQSDEKSAREKLEKALADLDKAREARLRSEIALQSASEKSENASKEIERLERELQQLVSGAK